MWDDGPQYPCRTGGSQRLRAGNKIRSGPHVGRLATSSLPSGVPNASLRCRKAEGAHMWDDGPQYPCRTGGSQLLRAGNKIRSGPHVGRLATSSLPSGVPNASLRCRKAEGAHMWDDGPQYPCRTGGSQLLRAGNKIRSRPHVGRLATSSLPSGVPNASLRCRKAEGVHMWDDGPQYPCRIGGPQLLRAGNKIRSGPHVGRLATSSLPSGVPNASLRCRKAEGAHLWDDGPQYPCRTRGSQRLRAGNKIRSGPHVGRLATSSLPSGVPNASLRCRKAEEAHMWDDGPQYPCRIGGSQLLRAGNKIRSGPHVGRLATSSLPSGVPNASLRGRKAEGAHMWDDGPQYPCRTGGSQLLRAGNKIRSGPHVGRLATPLPYGGSPTLHTGGQNQKGPTCGRIGYITLAV